MASLPVTYVEDFDDYDFKSPTAATCSYVNTWVSWRAVCGSTYYNASIMDIMGSQPLVLQPRADANAVLASTKVLAVDSFSFALATTAKIVTYSVAYSTDSVTWTTLLANGKFDTRSKQKCYYSLPERMAVYVRITIGSSSFGSDYRAYIDDFTFHCTAEPTVLSPETLYVTSVKDYATTSTMHLAATNTTLMSGTLAIADGVGNQGGAFRAVMTNLIATRKGLDATVQIAYTPALAGIEETCTMTAVINGLETELIVCARSLPDRFVVVGEQASLWSALPHDPQAQPTEGYLLQMNNPLTPTRATLAVDSALFGSKDWQSASLVWHTEDNVRYSLYDATALSGSGGYVCLDAHRQWQVSASAEPSLRLLPVTDKVAPAAVTVTDWTTDGICFIASSVRGIPEHDSVHIVYAGSLLRITSPLPVTTNGFYTLQPAGLDLTAAPAERLQLVWYKADKVVALTDLVPPLFIGAGTALNSLSADRLPSADVTVPSGQTLTIDRDTRLRDLIVKPGGKVVLNDGTLRIRSLSLHGGYYTDGEQEHYALPAVYVAPTASLIPTADSLYYTLHIRPDHYFALGVPFVTQLQDIRYSTLPSEDLSSLFGTALNFASFDGEARGKGDETDTKYWQPLTASDRLLPSVGYIVSAKRLRGEPYASLVLPMAVDSAWLMGGEQTSLTCNQVTTVRNQVTVGAWGVGSAIAETEQGWNCIAQPFLTQLAGDDQSYRYVTIPASTMDDYTQLPADEAVLEPFSCFFVQAATTETLTFDNALRQSVPARYAASAGEQSVFLSVAYGGQTDQIGLLLGDDYTTGYDFNADLAKELGTANTLRMFFRYDSLRMAFLALPSREAARPVPVTLRIPEDGNYALRLTARSRKDQLSHVYLIDREQGTQVEMTSVRSYSFKAQVGMLTDRFLLQVLHRDLPSALVPATDNGMTVGKYLKGDRMVIRVGNVLYDGVGRRIE